MNNLILLLSFASLSPLANSNKLMDLKLLSLVEKLSLIAVSTHHPVKYGNISSCNQVSSEEGPQLVDLFFVDFRSLLTQSLKVNENISLPEVNWSHQFEFCVANMCFDFNLNLATGNTKMTGQERITSVNVVTPTTFKNSFDVPTFVWESPGFLFTIDTGENSTKQIYRSLRFSVNNLKFETTFDYVFVPNMGIQINNLDIQFSITHLKSTIWIVGAILESGYYIPYPPIFTDWTAQLGTDWDNRKEEYIEWLQFRINCVLSDSRINPPRCGNVDSVPQIYHRLNVFQLFETIGLGALDRS